MLVAHALMVTRNGLLVDTWCPLGERSRGDRRSRMRSLCSWMRREYPDPILRHCAAKGHAPGGWVGAMSARGVTPHFAHSTSGRSSFIDGRTTWSRC